MKLKNKRHTKKKLNKNNKHKNNKNKSKIKKLKGGYKSTYDQAFVEPIWRSNKAILADGSTIINQWSTMVQLKHPYYSTLLPIYGSSLPSDNYYEKFSTLYYYYYVRDIKRLLSLHPCEIDASATYCDESYIPNGYDNYGNEIKLDIDRNSEPLIWQKFIKNSYLGIKIKDMTSGSIQNWEKIFKIDFTDNLNPLLIHCLAGFGRTGSVLLYAILLHQAIYKGKQFTLDLYKTTPFLGYGTWERMYNRLYKFMSDCIVPASESFMPSFDVNRIKNELFNINDSYHKKLFISRINNIILRISEYCGAQMGDNIYLITYKEYDNSSRRWNYFEPPRSIPATVVSTIAEPNNKFGFFL